MNTSDLTAIQKLLAAKPELMQRLEGASSRQEAAQRLAAIAVESGISAEAGEIERHLQYVGESELSDEQLATVAGGTGGGAKDLLILDSGVSYLSLRPRAFS